MKNKKIIKKTFCNVLIFFQNNEKVVLAVARKKMSAQSTVIRGTDETDGPTPGPQSHTGVKVEKSSHLEQHCFGSL